MTFAENLANEYEHRGYDPVVLFMGLVSLLAQHDLKITGRALAVLDDAVMNARHIDYE